MSLNSITCPDCGAHTDADAAQRERYEKSVFGAHNPFSFNYSCAGCGVQLRSAMWPLLFLIIPGLPLWGVGLAAVFGDISGHWVWAQSLPVVRSLGMSTAIGFGAMIVSSLLAKPVSCGR